MSESSTAVQAPDEYPYLEAAEDACLVGGHESISFKVDPLEKRYPDTVFCLMESACSR